jgi:hypothetical protein
VISTVGAPRRASRAERHSCAGFGLLIATRRFGRARAVTRADQAWAARTIENRGVSVRASWTDHPWKGESLERGGEDERIVVSHVSATTKHCNPNGLTGGHLQSAGHVHAKTPWCCGPDCRAIQVKHQDRTVR